MTDPADFPALEPVGETSFLRHWAQLDAVVRLAPRVDQGGSLLCWSAGCATGEEPYSLAMVLREAGRAGDRIIATDTSAERLAWARAARYGDWTLRRVDAARRLRWFRRHGEEWELLPALRDAVEFRRHDLAAEPPPWTFDVVLCRNVLIYFNPGQARRAAAALLEAVRPGGLLVLGPVELPAAEGLPVEWVEQDGATVLRRTG